jgi:type IV pilus assembly protein PilM
LIKRRPKHGPIGLDIGASSIKMLQLADVQGQPTILAAEHRQIVGGHAERPEFIRAAISGALRLKHFRGRDVALSLGSGEFQMKNVRLPRMPAAELAAAVAFEAQERFGFGGSAAQIRHIPVGEVRHGEEVKEEVIVLAAHDEVVDQRLAMLDSLKLRAVAIDIAPRAVALSFSRFLRREEDANSINVFLDVGYRGTSVVFLRGMEIAFLKLLDIGGQILNQAVATALGISEKEAGALRLRIMRESSGRRESDRDAVHEEIKASATDAVRPCLDRLIRDLLLCLRYFAVTFRGRRPESLTLAGGEAHEPLLARTIMESVEIPCIIGSPLRGMGGLGLIGGRECRSLQPAWAVAAGLALRGTHWITGGLGSSLGMSRASSLVGLS